MKIICDEHCAEYSHPGHPERPNRITRTLDHLRAQQELAITWAVPAPADNASVLRAHTEYHLARLEESRDFDEDTPFYPGIGDYARSSAGAALEALQIDTFLLSCRVLGRGVEHRLRRRQVQLVLRLRCRRRAADRRISVRTGRGGRCDALDGRAPSRIHRGRRRGADRAGRGALRCWRRVREQARRSLVVRAAFFRS